MGEKVPLIRFLGEQERAAQRRTEQARERQKLEEKAMGTRKQLLAMADNLDPPLEAAVHDAADMLSAYASSLKYRDFYLDAEHYLARAGYDYRSAVEDMPTVINMVEHALNHRSQIQAFLEAALTHLGISEDWLVRLRNGEMNAFFEEFGPGGDGKLSASEGLRSESTAR